MNAQISGRKAGWLFSACFARLRLPPGPTRSAPRDEPARYVQESITARLALFLSLAALVMAGCAREGGDEADALVIRYQGAPNAVSFPELAEDLGYLGDLKLDYQGGVFGGPEDLQALVTKDVDVATAFNGAIVKLAAVGKDLVSLVASYGSDRETGSAAFVLADSPIRGPRDLIGKKIAMNSVGAHSEFIIKEYLARGGLSRKEIDSVELVVLPPISSEAAIRAGQVDGAMMSGIIRELAQQRGGLRRLFVDVDLFGDFTGGYYVTTRELFMRKPQAYRLYVEGVAKAIEWARHAPREEVVARMVSIIERRGRNETSAVVQYWRSTGIPAKGGVVEAAAYQMWVDWLVEAGELRPGQIDVARMVDNRYNPYANEGAPQGPWKQERREVKP
ncbi:MAG: ABC transporter substrate-binding protein [Azoarcus sp.]|nr:ABC transporter substrate-binding protein [Azoarcus sp.]